MIAMCIVLALIALVAAGLCGWSIAARGRWAERRAAAADRAAVEQRVADAEERAASVGLVDREHAEQVAELRDLLATSRAELRGAQAALASAEHHAERAAIEARKATDETLARALAMQAAQRTEITSLRERLAVGESGREREHRAVAEVQRVLAPLMERERLAAQLARLEIGRGTRSELPRAVDAIAAIGGFSTVVLSDEAGLPLAVSAGSTDGEQLAGLWSMLLAVADRISTAGAPVPVAVVVHDASNQTILHRLFTSGGTRFLLSAVSRGRSLEPEALDPALGKLEQMLNRSALAVS